MTGVQTCALPIFLFVWTWPGHHFPQTQASGGHPIMTTEDRQTPEAGFMIHELHGTHNQDVKHGKKTGHTVWIQTTGNCTESLCSICSLHQAAPPAAEELPRGGSFAYIWFWQV